MNLVSKIKEEVRLLERTQGLAEIEKLKLEEELQLSKMDCEELKKKIKRVEELKDEEILVLRNKLLAADRELDKLRGGNSEAARSMEELKFQKLEAEKAAEFLKKKFEDLETTIRDMEVKVDDLDKLVNDMEKGNLKFHESECGKRRSGNCFTEGRKDADDVENVVVKSPGVGTNCDSAGIGCSVEASKTVLNSHSAPSDHNPSRDELENTEQEIKIEELQGSDAVNEQFLSVVGSSSKRAFSSSPAIDIIEISDSDDETNKQKRTEKSTVKRKRNMGGINDENAPIEGGYCNVPIECFNTVVPADLENAWRCDKWMDNLVASIRDTKEDLRK